MTIVSNPNVYSTAIRIAEKRGWAITTRKLPTSSEQEVYEWSAVKEDREVVANNPIELLGLIKIYEEQFKGSHEPYWWKLDGDKPWWKYTGQEF
ncbi:hypothetical protein [Microbulbifer hainanensis]|uniref:hypothetical protein n=1 Tax=Microbulbifer hainanensis TaxID=2735675 RepID=UPI0018673A8A|nr:hypothetical protein [Microbulbifer hainanensis]